MIPADEWEANNAETMRRRAARQAILLEEVIAHMQLVDEPQFARQVAETIGITAAQASPLLRELERAGRLVSTMVPMVNRTGPGRRYFRLVEGA